VCRDDESYARLREMRALYEPYAETMSEYLRMPLPPWIETRPHKDNWLAVAKLRAKTEAANPEDGAAVRSPVQSIAEAIDEHHNF